MLRNVCRLLLQNQAIEFSAHLVTASAYKSGRQAEKSDRHGDHASC
jgi:hypothetical protein